MKRSCCCVIIVINNIPQALSLQLLLERGDSYSHKQLSLIHRALFCMSEIITNQLGSFTAALKQMSSSQGNVAILTSIPSPFLAAIKLQSWSCC